MKIKSRILSIIPMMVLALAMLFTAVPVQAAKSPLDSLRGTLKSGKSSKASEGSTYYFKCSSNAYDKSGGGYWLYSELVQSYADKGVNNTIINEERMKELTAGGKKKFLTDMIKLGNYEVAYYKTQKQTQGNSKEYVSEQTMNDFMVELESVDGAGSQLIATLMAETKPDYVTANRIYRPLSGPINTILGFVSILIMALLGVTMALDIAYITIPAFQLFLDGDEGGGQGGQGGGAKGMAKIISSEARNAVRAAEDGGGGQGQSGSGNKLAISVYFKHRWKGLVVLGVCLLYLVQGQIYSFVAWVLDLVSGFVGF